MRRIHAGRVIAMMTRHHSRRNRYVIKCQGDMSCLGISTVEPNAPIPCWCEMPGPKPAFMRAALFNFLPESNYERSAWHKILQSAYGAAPKDRAVRY